MPLESHTQIVIEESPGFHDTWMELESVFQQYHGDRWAFRGHSNSNWELKSSLHRHNNSQLTHAQVEDEFVCDVQSKFHLFSDANNKPESMLDWLALMQHHGAYTRLLDITYSPYIATYFAASDEIQHEYSCIWAFRTTPLVKKAVEELVDDSEKRNEILRLPDHYIHRYFQHQPARLFQFDSSAIVPMTTFTHNARQHRQQGGFLVPTHVEKPISEIISGYSPEFAKENIHQIIFPSSMQAYLIYKLNWMNIDHELLFPGLDGLMQAKNTYLKTRTWYEVLRFHSHVNDNSDDDHSRDE